MSIAPELLRHLPRDRSDEALLDGFLDVRHRAGPRAVPGPGGGDRRAAGRQPRDPRHADRVGEVAGRPRRPLRRPGPGRSAASTPRRSRRWSARSSSPSAPSSAPSRSACSPATPRSTPPPRSSAARPRSSPTWPCGTAPEHPVDVVIMDEFHFYADRDRGWAWQVPLIELTERPVPADVGHARPGRALPGRPRTPHGPAGHARQARRAAGAPRVRVPRDAAARVARRARGPRPRAPSTSSTSPRRPPVEAAQALTSVDLCTREEKAAIREAIGGFRFDSPFGADLRRYLRPRHRRAPRRPAPQVPPAGREAGPGGSPQGHLRHRHARRGHQRAHPHRAVHPALQVRRRHQPGSCRCASSNRSPGGRGARATTTGAGCGARHPST